jgi:leader peptidase (prepilin peptidase)/N-methyltransferase
LPADWLALHVAAAALAGLLVGSFLNVCIYRIPRDISVVTPRSFCPECRVQIGWYDNVPLVSYLFLQGKCRKCGKKIGIRYPLVEATTGLLFAWVVYGFGFTAVAGKWIIWEAILIVLFWTDFEEQILPDELTLGGSLVGLIIAFFVAVPGTLAEAFFPGWRPLWRSLLEIAMGVVLLALPMWLLGVAYEKVRKREGLGFGDVKLLVLMSTFLGFENSLFATMVGAIGGAILGVIYCLVSRRKLSETQLPFGSFLCAGAAITPLINRLG